MNELEELRQENAKLKKRLEVYEDKSEKFIFANRLKQARKIAGMTQPQFAQKLGIVLSGVVAYEGGKREPSMSRLIQFADILDVSIDWLCGRTEKDESRITT